MPIPSHPMNCDALSCVLEGLEKEIFRTRERGRASIPDVQYLASSLVNVQLALNELEQSEVREHGASRGMAERFVVLETRIRKLMHELYQETNSEEGENNEA